MFNFKLISKVISFNLFIVAASMFATSGIALVYSEKVSPFIYSSLIAFIPGLLLFIISKDTPRRNFHRKDAYITVTLSWFLIGLAGSLPYLISGAIPRFENAFFESVSGFTTTGSSILTDIEALPKSILFWRSLTHWIGGIGIILLVIIILPSLKIGGYHLFTSESSFQEKIKPRIHNVAIRLLFIYILLTISETILLLLGNMNLFESVCHAFGTVATGGFSPKNTSIADYSPYIQYVIMVFMFLSGTNYLVHYYILRGRLNKVRLNDEFKFYFLITFTIGAIITGLLFFKMGEDFETAFRDAYFQVISIITCTGFASADYLLWPTAAWIIIFFAMFLGGSTGSTAGGIKMARHLIFFKSIKNTFKKIIHPQAILPIKLNAKPVRRDMINGTLIFILVYFGVFVVSTSFMLILGIDLETASSSVATCMAGIGPGIGKVGPTSNFFHLPYIAKIFLSFVMILGRLEIYPVIVLFTRSFWKS